ncbi:unnamed protein product, partial [Brachionus calyciflorus]
VCICGNVIKTASNPATCFQAFKISTNKIVTQNSTFQTTKAPNIYTTLTTYTKINTFKSSFQTTLDLMKIATNFQITNSPFQTTNNLLVNSKIIENITKNTPSFELNQSSQNSIFLNSTLIAIKNILTSQVPLDFINEWISLRDGEINYLSSVVRYDLTGCLVNCSNQGTCKFIDKK